MTAEVTPLELTGEDSEIRNKAWNGYVPICFTLHPDDAVLASDSNPLFLLKNRMCTLPVISLDDKYKKSLFRSISGGKPELWFEDKKTKTPLKWYLPIGVLYDVYKGSTASETPRTESFDSVESPVWDVVVHYSDYPDTLPHWDNEHKFKSFYLFTIKEAASVKFGDQKIINALTEEQTDSIMKMVAKSDAYTMELCALLDKLLSTNSPKSIPVRVCTKGAPFVQQKAAPEDTLRDVCVRAFGEEAVAEMGEGFEKRVLVHGVVVPLDTKMEWIYNVFAYPDNFVYIAVDK